MLPCQPLSASLPGKKAGARPAFEKKPKAR
jgi:hypothetical protein